jgi:2-keto-3-deoxy-L-fuconate dehydrogenase
MKPHLSMSSLICAGYVQASVLESDDREWKFSFGLTVAGWLNACRAVIFQVKTRTKGGFITDMASVISSVRSGPQPCAYATPKATVIGLAKSVAADFVEREIRCNALCPGTVDTSPAADVRSTRVGVAKRRRLHSFHVNQWSGLDYRAIAEGPYT